MIARKSAPSIPSRMKKDKNIDGDVFAGKKMEKLNVEEIFTKKSVKEKGIELFYRKISFPITKLFIRLGLNANQVSILGVEIGVISTFFFISGEPTAIIIGGLALFFTVVCDACDGNIARYHRYIGKKKEDLGGFFDWSSCLPRPLAIFALSIAIIMKCGEVYQPLFFILGILFSYFFFLNQVFYGLRKSFYNLKVDSSYRELINNKFSNTFNEKISPIFILFLNWMYKLADKFEISPFQFNANGSNPSKYRRLLRRTQDIHYLPFFFMLSGFIDKITQGFYATMLVWLYIGIVSIVLFIVDEVGK